MWCYSPIKVTLRIMYQLNKDDSHFNAIPLDPRTHPKKKEESNGNTLISKAKEKARSKGEY